MFEIIVYLNSYNPIKFGEPMTGPRKGAQPIDRLIDSFMKKNKTAIEILSKQ